ncbi:transposase [candidate division WOR-3 bacterium]|nr:transposase [candidate division WOR-3 bacterium]
MARPLRIQFPGAHYHITCRGIERRRIYMDDGDRVKYLALLAESLETYQVVLYAYVMMDKHFHLLVETRKANCSEFMRHFNIRYTGWFNWRHQRGGNLYQGRYQAYLVDVDRYLLEVSRYVHLNPVRLKHMRPLSFHERWQRVVDFPWSSLAGYLVEKRALDLVDYNKVLSMVGGRRAYSRFTMDGLKRDAETPFRHVRNRTVLGDRDFAASVKHHLRRVSFREQPAYREMISVTLELDVVLSILRREFGITKAALEKRGSDGVLRGTVAELLYKYCDLTQGQIGQLLGGLDYMSVYQLRSRLKKKLRDDVDVRKRFRVFETKLKESMSNV